MDEIHASYSFYPRKDNPCPDVGHCPHVGGAAIASLVLVGNQNELYVRYLHETIDAENQRNSRLLNENQRLSVELEQVKLELKLERQNKFATNKQKEAEPEQVAEPSPEKPKKKRGAPVGHTGWFRPTPNEYDWHVDVPAPSRCPHCLGPINQLPNADRHDHFQFDTTRAGQVSRDVLGPHFTGTLVTDCYSGYAAHETDKKQKCLAHLARTARDWQKLTKEGTLDFAFFKDVRNFVTRACAFHRDRAAGRLDGEQLRREEFWLRERLKYLSEATIAHKKAVTLQGRINRHYTEWLVFVDDSRVPPTNNLAERALRPLVVLRKITFGHRSKGGAERMAKLMTIAETARRHGHRASDIYFELLTRPPDAVMRRLYAPPKTI